METLLIGIWRAFALVELALLTWVNAYQNFFQDCVDNACEWSMLRIAGCPQNTTSEVFTMSTRSITIDIPQGDFTLKQSSGELVVRCNLDDCTPETIEWLFNKGLTLSIRNAYASKKTREARQIEAQRKADEIAKNFRKSGSSSQWTQLQSVMIRNFVTIAYNGTMPTGGMARVWQEIEALPTSKRDELQTLAQWAISIEI